jgi:hypothetical protein
MHKICYLCAVQRLEVELRQSYSTKNFTLKSGLLDIEKRHRDFIYENPAIEVLFANVLIVMCCLLCVYGCMCFLCVFACV